MNAFTTALGVLLLALPCAAASPLSPVAVLAAPDDKGVFVAEGSARRVVYVDVATRRVTKTFAIPAEPSGLALSPDGATLYVTGGGAEGKLFFVNPASGKITATVPVGHTPMGPAVAPDGKALYVCNRFDSNVSVIDVAAKKETARIRVLREAVGATVTPDGKTLVIANHLPTQASNSGFVSVSVSLVDTSTRKVVNIPLVNGSTGARGLCLSPDGAFAYVTHILARYNLPTTQLERGWVNTNALSVIDVAGRKRVNTVLLDDIDLGAANPWGVACSPDGKHLCVTHAGTHELSVIDRAALHARLAAVAGGKAVSSVSRKPDDVPNDLSFLVGARRRVRLAGNGPRAVSVVGNTACVAEYFSDSLSVVKLDAGENARATAIALGPKPAMSVARRGEMLFNDATMCFQHWQSCASCHPDARVDGLNWDLLNDGMGNPKNARSMLLAHKTPPVMSLAVRDTAETAVRAGIRHILFVVRPEADAAAIDAYLKALEPVPSPGLVRGKLSDAAKRGRKVFDRAGCKGCHPAPLYTQKEAFDVGTAAGMDKDKAVDIPTLVELWRTAPYLHDGRAATIREAITRHNPGDKRGRTSSLGKQELSDLIAFILSL